MSAVAPEWMDGAPRALERLLGTLEAPVRSQLRGLLDEVRADDDWVLSGFVAGRATTPLLALCDALREDEGLAPGRAALRPVGEAALFLYLSLRAQEAMARRGPDGRGAVGPIGVEVIDALAGAAAGALARTGGDAAALMHLRENALYRYATAATAELHDYQHGFAPPNPRRAGELYLPMALVPAAVALQGGRTKLDGIAEMMVAFGAAEQLAHQLLHAAEDYAAGRRTPVLDALGARGKLDPKKRRVRVLDLLISDPALDEMRATAAHLYDEARRAAEGAADAATIAAIRSRIRCLDDIPNRLMSLAFGLHVS